MRASVLQRSWLLLGSVWLLLSGSTPATSAREAVSIAAAANFVYALDALHAAFREAHPDVGLTTALGASGSLYAQIKHGAPFDILLSADTEYPRQLVQDGAAPPASFTIFARGRLVLWTTRDLPVHDPAALLRHPELRKLALAQPRTAPYGRAAQATLEQLGEWERLQPRVVLGENITQTAQFVETGNADAGFVALSLVLAPRLAGVGRWHEIAPELYANESLDHAAVLTQRGARNPAARQYLEFLRSPAARKILEEFGYAVP